jgi:hypothetical protein
MLIPLAEIENLKQKWKHFGKIINMLETNRIINGDCVGRIKDFKITSPY